MLFTTLLTVRSKKVNKELVMTNKALKIVRALLNSGSVRMIMLIMMLK